MNKYERTYPDDAAGAAIASEELYYRGLTKREHFAAMAMQGLLANPEMGGFNAGVTAREAARQADALIDALNVGQSEPTPIATPEPAFVPDDDLAF